MKALRYLLAATIALCAAPAMAGNIQIDAKLPEYAPAGNVAGSLSSTGSETLAGMMKAWGANFGKRYPGVKFRMKAEGSATAPPALLSGTANLAPMSREMTSAELATFRTKPGHVPVKVPVAADAVTVYVHGSNPIAGLTLAQLDAIFSLTHGCGAPADIRTWGQLGLTGEWANRPIELFGRNGASGTREFFREHVLCSGNFRPQMHEQADSEAVVREVAATPGAIGYAGFGFGGTGVTEVRVARGDHESFVPPRALTVQTGDYPMSRILYIYVDRKPDAELAPAVREFLRMVLSREGQEIVARNGFVPLQSALVTRALKDLVIP